MDVDTQPHPNPIPNPQHRKIDLQSSHDLSYLQANLSTAARQRLDLHFPPNAYNAPPATHIPLDPSEQSSQRNAAEKAEVTADPLRRKVEQLVDEFLTKTWNGARANITVNGLDAITTTTTSTTSSSLLPLLDPSPAEPSDPSHTAEREGIDFVYEPYDPRLSTKLAGLYAEVEHLTASVSQLRRARPQQAALLYQQALSAAIDADQKYHDEQVQVQALAKREAEEIPEAPLQLQPLPADVAEMYERGLSELGGLSGLVNASAAGSSRATGTSSLTETVGKVQRARTVTMELE